MASKHTERCSTLLIIWEMQIKTTMRYHITPDRIAIIKKFTNNKCWRGCGEKGTLLLCWWEYTLGQPLWKTVWKVIRKLKIELPMVWWWHPTPVLSPGKSHGWRSLVSCSPWGHYESDMTEWLHFHFHALEREMATHSSILALRIPGTGEPGLWGCTESDTTEAT